ncbi:MAG: hypothetical protein R2734_02755 [Nocardioides sp.]
MADLQDRAERLGCTSRWEHAGEQGGTDQRFDLSLACDDLEATMAELADRGAQFAGGIETRWGRTVQLVVPTAGMSLLYQPRYPLPALRATRRPGGARQSQGCP